MTTQNAKKWEEYEDDEKNYEPRTEVSKIVQPKEVVENGVPKTVNQTIMVTKRIFPVRRAVKERKNILKFGDVKEIPKGEHKVGDFAIGELIEIETPDSQEKNEIDLVKKIMKINTDTIRQRKQEQELNQLKDENVEEENRKEEVGGKREGKFRFVPQNHEELSIKIANISFYEFDNEGKEASIRDQENDFRSFVSKLLKMDERGNYNLKILKQKNKNKLLGIAYLQCSSRERIEEIEGLLQDKVYQNCVLEIGKPEPSQPKNLNPKGPHVKRY